MTCTDCDIYMSSVSKRLRSAVLKCIGASFQAVSSRKATINVGQWEQRSVTGQTQSLPLSASPSPDKTSFPDSTRPPILSLNLTLYSSFCSMFNA